MKICLVHNSYEQPGGEDIVFQQEQENLRRAGHDVIAYQRSNSEIERLAGLARIVVLKDAVWSRGTRQEFSHLLDREAPDLVHVHNTFFRISPSIYGACQERGIPVVQTLHNFRWICPAHTFYREGHVCEDCLEGSLWNGIAHGCYRGSRSATAGVAVILACHRFLETWKDSVDCYIALTEFARQKFIAAGFPPDKIHVKPNFVDTDPGTGSGAGGWAVYAGRLSSAKGLDTLLRAWEQLPVRCPLQIVGDGPDRVALEARARRQKIPDITFRGYLSRKDTIETMKEARFLIVPSVWYEGFPLVIAEAMACGTPVLCSRLGAMQEIVADRRTGLHFNPGDAADLARKVTWAWNHPVEISAMRHEGRREYEARYTASKNYALLMGIYDRVLRRAHDYLTAVAT